MRNKGAEICEKYLSKGDKVLVLGTGRFGPGWGELVRYLGVEVVDLDFGLEAAADGEKLTEVLRADKNHEFKAVMTVLSDTASSAQNNIPALRAAIDAADHPALFMVDCICSFACEEFRMDEWGVDVMVTACQKGLMTPAGLAFVFFNEKAAAVRNEMGLVSSYWDWTHRAAPDPFYRYFCGTAPTHHLYGLREALNMIQEEGIENVWARHHSIAQTVWAAIDAWSEGSQMRHNMRNPMDRSWAVSAVRMAPHQAGQLRAWAEKEAGLTLGIGLGLADLNGPRGDDVFRIGHMGWINAPMILGTLGTIDTGLKQLGFAHGDGAIAAATSKLSALMKD